MPFYIMIQEIQPNIFNNSFNQPKPDNNDYVIIFNDDFLIMNHYDFYSYDKCSNHDLKFAFKINNQNVFISDTVFHNNFKIPIKEIRKKLNKLQSFIAITAYQIYYFYKSNHYCGYCGNKLIPLKEERALICPKCKQTIYPKISPAVIVAIIADDKILLTKYNTDNAKYALVAGYCEIGETLEETVIREVKEEVGLNVKNITYYKSQPWAFSNSLLVGFFCELDGNDHITLDKRELKEASWFKKEEMQNHFDDITLTQNMMKAFKENTFKIIKTK